MPLYEYKCAKCGNVFEVLQKFSDQPLTVHKDCGGALERLISPSVFQFKGSGWYITDYAHKHGSSANNGEHANGHSGATKTESPASTAAAPASESKPAAPASKS